MDFKQIGTLGTPIFVATKNQLPEPDGSYKGIFFKTTYDPSSEEDYPKGTILTVVESGDGTFNWGKFLALEKLTNGITDASQLQKDVEAFDGEGNKIIGSSNEREKITSMIGETATEYELQSSDFNGLEHIIPHKFENNFGLKKAIIPEGISIIGDFAFHNCVNLEEVYIPSTVISIGESAFDSCYSLKKIVFAENSTLKRVGDNCFYETAISTIELPETLEEIGASAFSYCLLLESIFIPHNVKICGGSVFTRCENIKQIEFDTENTIQSIPNNFADWCSSLTEISLPASIQSIGRDAFSYSSSLKHIGELPSVKVIGKNAFYGCNSLQNDFLRNNNCLIEIRESAFYNCSVLTSITLPETLEIIENNAFYYCSNLIEICNKSSLTLTASSTDNGYVAYYAKNIYTPETGESKITTDSNGFVTYAGEDSVILIDYQGDSESLIIPEGVTEIGGKALRNAYWKKLHFVSVIIPDTVISIRENAFSSVEIESLTLGANLISIGSNAFYNCSSLFTIYNKSTLELVAGSSNDGRVAYYAKNIIDLTTTVVRELNGLSIINDGVGEVIIDYHGSDTVVDIPDGIYKIGDGAFAFSNITEVRLSKDTTEISRYAFYFCNNLKYITAPLQNNISSIGEYSFYSCYSMKQTCLDETSIIRTIGSCAFYNCLSLTNITLPETLESIGDRGFYSCENLFEIYNKSSLTLTIGAFDNGYIAYYAKNIYTPEAGESKITTDSNGFVTYTDGDSVILIGYEGDSESLIIPEGITEIGNYVFHYNQAVSVIFPESISKIGKYAFGYSKIENVSFQKDILLKNIDNYAFRRCNIKSIKLPKSIELIGVGAFEENNYLEKVEFEDGISISEIKNYTFYACPRLLNLEVPAGVTTIGSGAFYDGIRNLVLPNSISNIINDDFFIGVSCIGRYINFLGTLSEYINLNFGVPVHLSIINGKSKAIGIIDETVQRINRLSDNLKNDLLYVNCENANNLTEIANHAFYEASSLLSISFKEDTPLTSIGDYSFKSCTELSEITIPSSVTSIGDHAFEDCTSLKKVTFGENSTITEIGYSIFSNCSSLSEIMLPSGITAIGEESFRYSGLTYIEIPSGVTSIGNRAFDGTKITELVIPENVSTIGGRIVEGEWSSHIKNVVMKPETPPTAEYEPFGDPSYLDKITVKPGCGEIYKTATNWDIYADKIVEATE